MKLVEVIRGEGTDEETVADAAVVAESKELLPKLLEALERSVEP